MLPHPALRAAPRRSLLQAVPLQRSLRTALSLLLLAGAAEHGHARHGGAPPLPPPYQPPPPAYGGPPGHAQPGAPGQPASGAPSAPSGGSPVPPTPTPSAPGSGAGAPGMGEIDLSYWSYWWYFNRESFWDLREHLDASAALSGSDDFFLGHGGVEEARASMRPDEALVRGTIRPALLAALARESSADVLTACSIALARLGGESQEETARALRALLPHSNQEVAETAALSLGILGRDADLPLLAGLLLDSGIGRDAVEGTRVDLRVRAFAAYGLGLSSRKCEREDVRRFAVHSLVQALREDAGSRQEFASACVLSLGLIALPAAPPELPSSDGPAPPASSGQALIAWLLAYAEDAGRADAPRAHALTSAARVARDLVHAGTERARDPVLLSCIDRLRPHSDGPRELRQSAVLALGFLLDADADELDAMGRAALVATPEHFPDQSTRNFALIALARAGGRVGTGMSPGSARPAIARRLLDQLARGSNMQRPWSALALGLLARRVAEQGGHAPDEWLDPLRQRLGDERSAGELSAWAIALGLARDESAGAALTARFLDRGDPYARGHLAEAIGLCGHRRAKNILREELRENLYRPVLLSQLSLGLGLLEDAEAVPILVEMLDDSSSLASQASLASALGRIGDRRAVAPLVELLADGQRPASARAFAAVALGLIGDLDELSWSVPLAEGINYRASAATLYDADGRGVLNLL